MRRVMVFAVAAGVAVVAGVAAGGVLDAPGRHSLNGLWEVAAGAGDGPPGSFGHTVPVPGYLDQADPGFPRVGWRENLAELLGGPMPDYEWFWYRRGFELGGDAEMPVSSRLVVHKAAFGAEVWVNGARVGYHAPSHTPGWFDVSGAVRPGRNELVIRIGARPGRSPAVSGIEPERKRMLPGLWDDVELVLGGPVYVEELQAVPLPGRSAVRLHGLAINREGAGRVPYGIVIREWESGRVVARGDGRLDFPADGAAGLDHTLAWEDARLWSPGSPFLYEAVIDWPGFSETVRFGMRWFVGRRGERPGDGRFLLNGRVIYLRGSNVCYGRWTEDPARGGLPWDEDWVRALMRQWKGLNYNAFRASIGPLPRMWYRVADEEGLLIQDEYAIWQLDMRRITPGRLAAEYRQWMAARWNHPSVVIFDAQNETLHKQNGAVTGEALARVRDLDLSGRPWDNGWMYPDRPGDASERHPYVLSRSPPEGLALLHRIEDAADRTGEMSKGIYLSPDGRVIPGGLNPLMAHEGYDQVMEWSRHPMVVNEFEWLWLSRDGQPIAKEQYRTYLGADSTEAERRAFRARVNAAMTEFWRTARTSAAVMNFEGLSFPGIVEGRPEHLHNTSDPYLDVRTLALDPVFEEEIRDANAPTGLMLFFFHSEWPAAGEIDLPVLLVNDRDQAVGGDVTVELWRVAGGRDGAENKGRADGAGGGPVFSETRPVALEALGKGEVGFRVVAPETPGEYRWKARLRLDAGETVLSRRDFTVVGPSDPLP